jgi:glycosyltransferase involved in cell wall biosynthesis
MPSFLENATVQVPRYSRQLRDLWLSEGPRGVVERLRTKLSEALAPKAAPMEVRQADVLAVDLSNIPVRPVPELGPGQDIAINWITVPPSQGAGGATTIFRIINYLEAHGYRNRVYFYDVYGGDHRYYADIVRSYFGFHGPVGRVEDGMQDAHAVVATAWATAYPAFNAVCTGKRFYFVQDFEPYFHPVGAESILAENTYRMGFYGITAGRWLAQKLQAEFAMDADFFDFGCDTRVYHRIPGSKRNGVVFYARPGAARRGFELGLMAMELFAARRPDITLHFYGDSMGKLPFPFIDHGKVTPAQLNGIYNRCFGGLSLSMTNVSLVPHEMLAAGCIPVVNDADHNRLVLDNSYVRYAAPNPHALAAALESVVASAHFDVLSADAAGSVHTVDWSSAGAKVDRAIRRTLNAPAPHKAGPG